MRVNSPRLQAFSSWVYVSSGYKLRTRIALRGRVLGLQVQEHMLLPRLKRVSSVGALKFIVIFLLEKVYKPALFIFINFTRLESIVVVGHYRLLPPKIRFFYLSNRTFAITIPRPKDMPKPVKYGHLHYLQPIIGAQVDCHRLIIWMTPIKPQPEFPFLVNLRLQFSSTPCSPS